MLRRNGNSLLLRPACRSTQRGLASDGAVHVDSHLMLIDDDSLAAYVSCVGAGLSLCPGRTADRTSGKRKPKMMMFIHCAGREPYLENAIIPVSPQESTRSTNDF